MIRSKNICLSIKINHQLAVVEYIRLFSIFISFSGIKNFLVKEEKSLKDYILLLEKKRYFNNNLIF